MLLVAGTFIIVTFVVFLLQDNQNFGGLMVGVFAAFFASVIVLGASTFLSGALLPSEYKLESTVELANLRSADGFAGRFIFGSGNVQTSLTYIYYTKDANGGMRPNQLAAESDSVVIFEQSDRTTGELRVYRRTLLPPWNLISFTVKDLHYEFYVPEGSVVLDYSVR
jgi:hypothetical protein